MISFIEHGTVDLPISRIEAIAKALGVSPREILGYTTEDENTKDKKLINNYYKLNKQQQKLVGGLIKELLKI